MRARNYDTRLSKAAFEQLISNPAQDIISLPCNALLKAVPKGAAFPYDGFTIIGQQPFTFTSSNDHVDFYGERGQYIHLNKTDLYINVGLDNWELIAQDGFNVVIAEIFKNNEQGFAYDISDLTSLFQDINGTVPVTSEGQDVRFITDKSGRGNHAKAVNPSTLKYDPETGSYYIERKDSNSFFVTSNIDFTANNKFSLFAGLQKINNTTSIIAELSPNSNNVGDAFYLACGVNPNDGYSSSFCLGFLSHSISEPVDKSVIQTDCDISTGVVKMRKNGINGVNGTTAQTTGSFGNHPLYIGARSGTDFPYSGRLYSLVGIGRLTTNDEITALESLIAQRVGTTL